MNKFYLLSIIIHLFLMVGIFLFSVEKEVKFEKKREVVVSISNKLNIKKETSNLENKINEENNIKAKDIKEENDVKEEKILKKEEPKKEKIVKKEIIKEKKNIIKDIKNTKEFKESPTVKDEFQNQERFILNSDGIYTLKSGEGIEYHILKEIDPKYPEKAKKIGYSKLVTIKVKFLVDINGEVKNIEITSGEEKYGFKEEVIKALKNWKFKPIKYKDKIIRVYFEKEFKFKRK